MKTKMTPLKIEGINESIYAGFWLRLGSLLLDFLIMLPYIFLILYIDGLSKNAYYFTIIPGFIFQIWFMVYLVKKYGGTPGKLIVGIKIIKLDGTDVTWKEAILREIVNFILFIFITIITVVGLSKANETYYESLGWMYKQEYLLSLTPIMNKVHMWLNNIWVCSELIFLLFNKRKRAIHDYIANTVIVKKEFLLRIRQVMDADETQTFS